MNWIDAKHSKSRRMTPDIFCYFTSYRPANFPVENGQLLTQRTILCRERCSGHDQASDEGKES
jgi:hypothetical protein